MMTTAAATHDETKSAATVALDPVSFEEEVLKRNRKKRRTSSFKRKELKLRRMAEKAVEEAAPKPVERLELGEGRAVGDDS